MNTLEFEIHNQTLIRVDSQEVINKNKNVYKCRFTFDEESEWINLNKFVIFTDGWGNSITQHLGNNSNILSCLVPDKMLNGSYFKISVYAGDLITTNTVSIALIQSGYHRPPRPSHNGHGCYHNGQKDIFVEIFDRLDNTVDSIFYDNNTLHLYCRDVLLESIYLPFLTREDIIELVNSLTEDFIIPLVSRENDGLMSNLDKVKLDNIEDGANRTIIDKSLDITSDNPVSNKVITGKLSDLQESIDDNVELINNMNSNVDSLDDAVDIIKSDIVTLSNSLDNKEDVYDYVERLDNLIVALIQKGE